MIGRLAKEGVLADVGPRKVAQVAAAGALIAVAAVAHYALGLPAWVTIALRDELRPSATHAVLMRGDLTGLPFLLRLGRATARTINVNLFAFGLVFNTAMLVLSASGVLTPVLGAIDHNLGSVAVVLNSAWLLRFR